MTTFSLPLLRHGRVRAAVLALTLSATTFAAPNAFAASKEMIQLQTQVQQLQDAVARLQQSNDERMGVLKDLVQQTADSVNKMGLTVGQLQQQVAAQAQGEGGKVDQVSGQVQSLNDSLDELKARLQRIEKSLGDVQSSQQSLNARLEGGAAPGGSLPAATGAGSETAPVTNPRGSRAPRTTAPPPGFPSDSSTETAPPAGTAPAGADATPAAATGAPPVADLYQTAFGDYNAAKYSLAKAEFNDVIRFYPDSNFAGNAYFYLGEMLFKTRDYGPATRQYDKVIEQYPGNPKIPAAQLRKGQALIGLHQTEAGARELRSLIQRYPNSPEATTARARLGDLGMGTTAARAR
ncbi:outer membrane protein assembly factor BamD [Terriglobus aquaticus]|uniref:Outer membrane protein assembly factor BamD n=1 Tax=Terriglobus aquaticus TaxID=940139 RepID=A0ABW9KL29_9BACT|nr:outer membrane protein assembly factor BamD [Terriglobus aquaticus]